MDFKSKKNRRFGREQAPLDVDTVKQIEALLKIRPMTIWALSTAIKEPYHYIDYTTSRMLNVYEDDEGFLRLLNE